ncbi:hypothetical protein PC116_g25696 [Phytophthora cactorum]|nr:hypothetical protein PC116_g25696 [Phytophthora cactorum]
MIAATDEATAVASDASKTDSARILDVTSGGVCRCRGARLGGRPERPRT